jgi:formylglycine-generating enzyme required for sulfatase activity
VFLAVCACDGGTEAPSAPQGKLPDAATIDLGGGASLELVLVKAGEFDMGSPDTEEKRKPDEGPVHRVEITKPFYMGKYEVTCEQWNQVMPPTSSSADGGRRPVENVSWDDIQKFLEKLNALGKGSFRLPTEAEWEYSCRAGTTTTFFFGNTLTSKQAAITDESEEESGTPAGPPEVGGFAANAFGLHDMHGGVWEWCGDVYNKEYYSKSPASDPEGPESGAGRVLRGGSYMDGAHVARSARRNRMPSGMQYSGIGFRVVKETK